MSNNPDRHKYFSENGAEMLQTVAIRTPKHLCIKDNSLIIREKGSSVVLGKIALSDIWVIIIDNPQVTMTSALISGINDARYRSLILRLRPYAKRTRTPLGGTFETCRDRRAPARYLKAIAKPNLETARHEENREPS